MSLAEFVRELPSVAGSILAHHAAQRDFSRWIRDVFSDLALADSVRRAEEDFRRDDPNRLARTIDELIALRYTSSNVS